MSGTAVGSRPIDAAAVARLNRLRRRLTALLRSLSSMPVWEVLTLGLLSILLVAMIDFATGPLLSLAIFYLIPVVATAWLAGRAAGIALAVAGTVAWSVSDSLGPVAEPWSTTSYWDSITLFALFVFFVVLVNWLKITWEQENRLLAEVQARLLPKEIPEVEGCEIASEWRPAGVVGGDYYDVLRVDGGATALCIADVSGKGMPAALVMSNVQAGLRALITEGVPPARLLGRLNDLLRENVRTGTFVTLFLGVLDPGGHRLVFSNAGHNPPILMRADGTFQRLFGGGPVLGVLPGSVYEAHEVVVGPGDRLVMYTDGLTERADDDGEEYGEARLVEMLSANRRQSAAGLRDAIVADVTAFSTSAFEDDLTVLVAAILK
jgi:hypothetical protein